MEVFKYKGNMGLVSVLSYFPFLFMLFDVYYFLRGIFLVAYHKYICRSSISILEESQTTGYCTTNDLDLMLHMNNSRYLRECDFGRFKHWMLTGVWDTNRSLNGYVTLGCSTIRYRKSLELGNRYKIRTKILCWDEDAFFVEQKIERTSDNFLCALVWVKQTFRKVTPEQIVTHICGSRVTSPEFPEEIRLWNEAHKTSSEKLKSLRTTSSASESLKSQ